MKNQDIPKESRAMFLTMLQSAREKIPFYKKLNITEENMEALYKDAVSLYLEEDYGKALQRFQQLIAYNHLDPRAWMGIGDICKKLKAYDVAIQGYLGAAILQPENPEPGLQIVDSWMALGEYPAALEAAETTLRLAEKDPKYAGIKRQVQTAKEALKKQLS